MRDAQTPAEIHRIDCGPKPGYAMPVPNGSDWASGAIARRFPFRTPAAVPHVNDG
jgi:hypothetical protein